MVKKLRILADENIPYLRGRLEPLADVTYLDQNDFTPELARHADALLIRTRTRCNAGLLEGSAVKLVATATIGTDQIDIPWCKEAGIAVENSPGCNAPAVAQYVWSSILRLGFDPARHRLGIVGCGNVGGIIADWGHRMGVSVLISDPPKERAFLAAGLPVPEEYVSLEKVLRESDAVTLHTPLTLDGDNPTYHLIGKEEMNLMHPGAILVNAARGPVVDIKALDETLDTGRIRAVIDTWEGEPAIDPAILDKVEIGTFHIAGYSRQGKERATRMVLEAVERHFQVSVDKSGLTGAYTTPSSLNPAAIIASYDPYDDDRALRMAPESFEQLRHDYRYREEYGNL